MLPGPGAAWLRCEQGGLCGEGFVTLQRGHPQGTAVPVSPWQVGAGASAWTQNRGVYLRPSQQH